MLKVALVTWSGLPELSPGDRLLHDALVARGATVQAAVWDDPAVAWTSFDRIVIRSTWDYHKRVDAFAAWLDARAADGSPLWNPPALVRRNLHKRYLLDLAARGVPIVPTELVPRGTPRSLDAIRTARGWSRVVVKPAVAATAFRTALDPDPAAFTELLADNDVLVQPFLEEVVRDGEWSLIFLSGRFSHAVLKRPRAGDFRVQNDFGGTAVATVPAPRLVAEAARVVDAIDSPWLYARVDGVIVNGTFLLMELELTEPALFLELSDEAVARFADLIDSA
jgi:hypothetical protein